MLGLLQLLPNLLQALLDTIRPWFIKPLHILTLILHFFLLGAKAIVTQAAVLVLAANKLKLSLADDET